MQMYEAVVCVGCGNEIPKTTDRRNISTKQAKEVSSLWRDCLREIARARQLTLEDSIFRGIFSDEGGIRLKDHGYQRNMCRKCYYLYDKTVKSHQVFN